MKKLVPVFLLSTFWIVTGFDSCDESTSPVSNTYLEGEVYSIGYPGPVPVDWTPPIYQNVCTVQIFDVEKNYLSERSTDNNGHFKIELQPGVYYLRVKESLVPAETGPFELHEGEALTAFAHYDNGMR